MSPMCAALIRVVVTPLNARRVEQECQAALCEAHAYGDIQDVEAMRGKIRQCHEAQWPEADLYVGPTLGDLIKELGGCD